MTHFLFPASPLNPRTIDEAFFDQAMALKSVGFGTSSFSIDANRVNGTITDGAEVVYRGWMMTGAEYEVYESWLAGVGYKALTSSKQYLAAHYLPNWYSLPTLENWTPSTAFFPNPSMLGGSFNSYLGDMIGEYVRVKRVLHERSGEGPDWKKFQLKDYVKSLKTDGGSTLENVEDIASTLEKMKRWRGVVEGGICVRAHENFMAGSEKRYFVVNGRYFSQDNGFDLRAMRILDSIKDIVPSPFWSVDIAERIDGEFRIVEIGDGQVSDLVGWTPKRFAEIWK